MLFLQPDPFYSTPYVVLNCLYLIVVSEFKNQQVQFFSNFYEDICLDFISVINDLRAL